jgi:DnaJ-class molecular chaperone
LTPFAELLVDPAADDAAVRRAYHALVRGQHPDSRPDRSPGPRWHALAEAYQMVETTTLRRRWLERRARATSVCAACRGAGVRVKTLGRDRGVRVCEACGGEGRTSST